MQPFGHDKSCSVSQFINGKSRNLQKSLNYLSEIATSTFDVDTPGCAGWIVSHAFLGCGSRSGVFSTVFVIYLNNLPSEALSSTSPVSSLQIS